MAQRVASELSSDIRQKHQNKLIIRDATKLQTDQNQSATVQCLLNVIEEAEAAHVVMARRYDVHANKIDDEILKAVSQQSSTEMHLVNTSSMYDELHALTPLRTEGVCSLGDTHVIHWCPQRFGLVPRPTGAPPKLPPPPTTTATALHSDTLSPPKMPSKNDWAKPIKEAWPQIGEAGALAALDRFVDDIESGLLLYEKQRSRADLQGSTSRLSAHLRFGELSPRCCTGECETAGSPL